MRSSTIRAFTVVTLLLSSLSACSSHCNCPACPQPQQQPSTTTIIQPAPQHY